MSQTSSPKMEHGAAPPPEKAVVKPPPEQDVVEARKILKKARQTVSYSLAKTQAQYGNEILVPLPLVNETFDQNISPVRHGKAVETVADIFLNLDHSEPHHRSIALVQVSGGGKSKLAADLCLIEGYWPVYIPLKSVPGAARRPAVQALKEKLDAVKPATNRTDDDYRVDLVTAFVVAHTRVAHALYYILTTDDDFKTIDTMEKRLLFVYCQRGSETEFSNAATAIYTEMVNSDPQILSSSNTDAISRWNFQRYNSGKKHKVCIVYDEVTVLQGILTGYFLHKISEKADDPDVYIATQQLELKGESIPADSPFQFATDLLYVLRRVMSTMVSNRIPQMMMDTSFSIAQEIFKNEGSETRQQLDVVRDLPGLTPDDIATWFEKVFFKDVAVAVREQLPELEDFCGRPRIFYDFFLGAFFPHLKRNHANVSVVEIAKQCIRRAKAEVTKMMKKIIHAKASATDSVLSERIHCAFAEAWRKDGCFTAESETLQTLISEGLIFSDGVASDNGKGNFKTEKLLWSTMCEYFRLKHKLITDAIINVTRRSNPDNTSSHGKAAEYALGWRLWVANGKPFSDVFKETHPKSPAWLREGKIFVEEVCEDPEESDFSAMLYKKPNNLIFPDNHCGPDVVFTILNKSQTPVRVYIQIKIGESRVPFPDAFYSTEPSLFYLNRRSQLAKLPLDFTPTESISKAFRTEPALDERHVRIIVTRNASKPLLEWMDGKQKHIETKPVLVSLLSATGLDEYFPMNTSKKFSGLVMPKGRNGTMFDFPKLSEFPEVAEEVTASPEITEEATHSTPNLTHPIHNRSKLSTKAVKNAKPPPANSERIPKKPVTKQPVTKRIKQIQGQKSLDGFFSRKGTASSTTTTITTTTTTIPTQSQSQQANRQVQQAQQQKEKGRHRTDKDEVETRRHKKRRKREREDEDENNEDEEEQGRNYKQKHHEQR